MVFALAGNPNCGKTALFNALTGSNCHVGNYPGVTVDIKSGHVSLPVESAVEVVDLPGLYSLRPYSQEEKTARDFLLGGEADGIINIIDVNNAARNLYLTLQVLEVNIPTVLAVNMIDELSVNGGSVNTQELERMLGIPVVPICALSGDGVKKLINTAYNSVKSGLRPRIPEYFGEKAFACVSSVGQTVKDNAERKKLPVRFAAIKLVEGEPEFEARLGLNDRQRSAVRRSVCRFEENAALDATAAMACERYTYIEKVCTAGINKGRKNRSKTRSAKIDRLLTGKYTALPAFVLIMVTVFFLTFNAIGSGLSAVLSSAVSALKTETASVLLSMGVNPGLRSLIVDGALSGVGSILSFFPVIMTLFFFLSVLEDTGYMARVAFLMDKPMRRLGLSGKSIVPLIIGFGCTVPAVMASRTLSFPRDRRLTVMLTPYICCSAKLPVLAFLSSAFFAENSTAVMCMLYAASLMLGVAAAVILGKAVGGVPAPFIMELPDYRFPSLKSVMRLLSEKAKDFIMRAFSVVFIASVLIWCLEYFNITASGANNSEKISLLAFISEKLVPVFSPLGFGDWRAVAALISGLAAKESIISTLNVLTHGVSPHTVFSASGALSYLVFVLLYTPCIAAVSVIKKEIGSLKSTVVLCIAQFMIAWCCAFAVNAINIEGGFKM